MREFKFINKKLPLVIKHNYPALALRMFLKRKISRPFFPLNSYIDHMIYHWQSPQEILYYLRLKGYK